MSRRRVMVAAMIAACGGSSRRPAENHVSPDHRAQLLHEAEQALRDEAPLDYARPMTATRPEAHARTVRAFLAACTDGDHASCWKALAIAPAADRPAIAKLVAAACKAGDALSCRALPVDPDDTTSERFADLPGGVGRSTACDWNEDPRCDRAALRTECTAGFALSCNRLAYLNPAEPDAEALRARWRALAAESCEAWIAGDCTDIARFDSEPKQALARERMCTLRHQCNGVAHALEERHELAAARDAYERACQYADEPSTACIPLLQAYFKRGLAPAMPGRPQALADWLCARDLPIARKVAPDDPEPWKRVLACEFSQVR